MRQKIPMQELEPKVQGGELMCERGHNCGILQYIHALTLTHTHTTEHLKNAWLFTLVSLTSMHDTLFSKPN